MPGHYNKKPMGMKIKKKPNTSNAVKAVRMTIMGKIPDLLMREMKKINKLTNMKKMIKPVKIMKSKKK